MRYRDRKTHAFFSSQVDALLDAVLELLPTYLLR
jgi:hypothetical protein